MASRADLDPDRVRRRAPRRRSIAPPGTRLPAGLLDSGAFPHRPDRVELRETAGSWVFLAGERASQGQKAGRDARTTARVLRRGGRVNRRLAPSVYAGVVPRPARAGRPAVAEEHDPRALEYAVEMRRYDVADARSDAADGRATETSVAAVGGALARFHAGLAPEVPDDGTDRLIEAIEGRSPRWRAPRPAWSTPRGSRRWPGSARRRRRARPRLREREAAGWCATATETGAPSTSSATGRSSSSAPSTSNPRCDASTSPTTSRSSRWTSRAATTRSRERSCAATRPPAGLRATAAARLPRGRARGSARATRRTRAIELLALAERFAWRARLPRVVCVAGLTASGKSTLASALGYASALPVSRRASSARPAPTRSPPSAPVKPNMLAR